MVYHGELAEAAPPPSDRLSVPSALVADDNAAGYAVSTLDRRLAAIGWVHETENGYDNACRHACIPELTCHGRQDEKCLRSRWFDYCALFVAATVSLCHSPRGLG